jgi:hypothetical protein
VKSIVQLLPEYAANLLMCAMHDSVSREAGLLERRSAVKPAGKTSMTRQCRTRVRHLSTALNEECSSVLDMTLVYLDKHISCWA